MAINFPASPSTNDTHTENAITWIFNGTSWDAQDVPVTAASIGLGSVDNTADADKPVSTAQQAALDAKPETLAEVAALTDTTAKSLFAMTAAADLEFRDSSGDPLLYLDEANGLVGIGTAPYSDGDSIGILNIVKNSSKILDLRMDNTAITSGAGAFVSIHVRESGGDPAIGFGIDDDTTGNSIGNSWHMGLDNSDSDKFVFSQGGIGTNNALVLTQDLNVGIGSSAPQTKLDILVDGHSSASFGASNDQIIKILTNNLTANNWVGITFGDSGSSDFDGGVGLQYLDHTEGSEDTEIAFFTRDGGSFGERARVTAAGIETSGDVETVGSANGLILESPDGTRWRVTVDNAGALSTTSL